MTRRMWDLDAVKEFAMDNGCKYNVNYFDGVKNKYEYVCSCGTTFSKRFDGFIKAPRCFNCGHRRGRGIQQHIYAIKQYNEKSNLPHAVIFSRKDLEIERPILVDREDLEFLLEGSLWSINKKGYASRHNYVGSGKELMHRLLFEGIPDGLCVDHINGNKLDNRRSNLRLATVSQNMRNSGRRRNNNSTQYKGVTIPREGKFRARIGIDGERNYLGDYDTAEDAARAYNEAAIELHGAFANLNVIKEDE